MKFWYDCDSWEYNVYQKAMTNATDSETVSVSTLQEAQPKVKNVLNSDFEKGEHFKKNVEKKED